MNKILRMLGRSAGKVWAMKNKKKNRSGISKYEVHIPKSISRKLRRQQGLK